MTILLDGAMGTELEARGARMELPLWSAHALVEAPALVEEIHLDYLRAGAQVISTNTFRTHARSLAAGEMSDRAGELTRLAVALARRARDRFADEAPLEAAASRIAGSISPLEDCYAPDRSPVRARALPEHQAMARDLAEGGCDLLLVETMGRIDEACAAVEAAAEQRLPIWLAVVCRPDGALLGGESLARLAAALDERVSALLVNCTELRAMPRVTEALVSAAALRPALQLGIYPHTGQGDPELGFRPRCVDSEGFSAALVELAAAHPRLSILGSCCGSDPSWTRALALRLHRDREARAAARRELVERVPRVK